jgi:two-component sensor histidine kinase
VPAGKISVSWTLDGDAGAARALLLNWVEQGGPLVTPPQRKGFGHIVIGEMVERSLGAKVAMEFAAEGLNWSVSIPASNLVSEAEAGD